MNKANVYEQAQNAEAFIEPQVQPDIDGYLRKKLASATAIKQQYDALTFKGRKFVQRLHTREASEALLIDLTNAGKLEEAEEVLRNWKTDEVELHISLEEELQRKQDMWYAAARGDFTAINCEITRISQLLLMKFVNADKVYTPRYRKM